MEELLAQLTRIANALEEANAINRQWAYARRALRDEEDADEDENFVPYTGEPLTLPSIWGDALTESVRNTMLLRNHFADKETSP